MKLFVKAPHSMPRILQKTWAVVKRVIMFWCYYKILPLSPKVADPPRHVQAMLLLFCSRAKNLHLKRFE